MAETIQRLKAVLAATGLSRSTLYLRISQRLFTRQISLGGRVVGWPAREVAALNAARIAGKSDEQVRQLVAQLEAARASAF